MPATRTCAKCGATLSAESALDVCPRCVAAQVLSPQTVPDGTDASASPTGTVSLNFGSLEQPGDRIGRYKLLQKIGEGGCGVVYMAEQEEPVRRRVALKVIKLGMDTKSVIARFEAERQALAMMDHPNIAKVLDAGATDQGRPYFVMELVRGIKITDYCDQNNLPTAGRLDLFTKVCSAIQHAHQKGIIHRDIKPSNILVTLHDGVPVPKVIDFGIAKATSDQRLTDKTVFTAFEQFIGTPAYMSPEQAEMSGLDIDTRTDIYALGVLLYELLTGKTPFDQRELMAAGIDEMRRTIREQEPVRPSTKLSQTLVAANVSSLQSPAAGKPATEEEVRADSRRRLRIKETINLLRGDLDWIVMKALEKDRTRRYETANGLATDIQRHLNNEPIVARPPSRLYTFRKLVRRNKVAFAAATAVLAALLAGLGFSTWTLVRERAARRHATIEAAKSQQVAEFLKNMIRGMKVSVAMGRDTGLLREITDQMLAETGKNRNIPPEVAVELQATIGSVLHVIGEPERAEALHRETLPAMRNLLGNEHRQVRALLRDYACVLQHRGKHREAEAMAREALDASQKLDGPESLAVAESLGILSITLVQQKQLTEAEQLSRESLAIYQKVLGPENREVAGAISEHASVLGKLGRHAEAERLYREALTLARKLFGNQHPLVAYVLRNFGDDLYGQRKLAEAAVIYAELLPIQKKLLGAEHPDVAITLLNLSGTLIDGGKPVEGEPYARACLAIRQKLRGPEHAEVAEVMNNVASALWKQGRLVEAETMYRDVLAMLKKVVPADDARVTLSRNNLGSVLTDQGKFAEAEVLFSEVLAETADSPRKAQLLHARGTFRARSGRWSDAVSDFTKAIELTPENHEYYHKLAPALLQAGDLAGYRRLRSEILQRFAGTSDAPTAERMAKDCLILPLTGSDLETAARMAGQAVSAGGNHPYLTWFLHAKAMAEYRQGHYTSAAESANKVLEGVGTDAERDVQTYMILAMAHHQLQHASEARAALSRGIEIAQTKLPKPDNSDLGEGWHDWIIAQTLVREAKALIEAQSE